MAAVTPPKKAKARAWLAIHGHLLGAGRLGIGVVGGPEDGGEELDLDDLAGGRVDEPRLLARVVDGALSPGRWSWRMDSRRRSSQRR
jgi:hypothetical protein